MINVKNPIKQDLVFTTVFWLLLVYVVGLFFINLPPLDDHNWRQTLTLTIARNFTAPDANILFPKYDIGKSPGIMSAEFPFYNYVLSFFYKVFGYNDWSGRFLNWTVTFIGFLYFYKLLKKFNSNWMAFFSTMFLMFSVVLVYARKTMPDTFALSLVLIGIFYAWQFLEKMSWKDGVLAFAFLTVGFLNKISFLPPAAILVIPFLDSRNAIKTKLYFGGIMVLTFSALGFWYGYWMPYLLDMYGNQLIWPTTLQEGWTIFIAHTDAHLYILKQVCFKNAFSFYLSVTGILFALLYKDWKYIYMFVLYTFIAFLFVLKTAGTFHTHEYYVIMYVPLMAMNIGYFFDKLIHLFLFKTLPYFFLLLTLVLSFFPLRRTYEDIQATYNDSFYLSLESIVDRYIDKSDSVMVNYALNPSLAYFTGRKGWSVENQIVAKKEWMEDFKKDGLKLIVIDRRALNDTLPYTLLYEDEHFRLYKP